MVASKGRGVGNGGGSRGGDGGGASNLIQPECCMCGDYGLSEMLFRCKICNFRSQHKYCSNEYPKAESYKACNWCLTQKHDSGNSTSKNISVKDRRDDAVKNQRNPNHKIGGISLRKRRGSEIKLTKTAPVKKLLGSSSPDESPVSTGRERGVAVEKNHMVLRKSKSANHFSLSNDGGIKTRPVFRNKVRRYKLLEEVSSQ